MAGPSRPPNNDFDSFDHGHQDVVTVINYNFYGKRKVTGSTDHRLRVFDRQADGSWKLMDTWRGHDAEVLEAKWSSPFMGQIIGSIGEDQKFKIWEEDVYEPPNSGHRFKCIFTIQSPSRIPYVSFDFKAANYNDMHLALLSRDALLAVYEADEPESMSSWLLIDQFHVCPPPVRGEETAFKVHFDPNPLPCWKACRAGLRENVLSLLTAGMNTVKLWRTTTTPTVAAGGSDRHFYLAADLSPEHHGLIRDVAWAPLNVRGWDLIATTCRDGYIRIFEVHYPDSASSTSSSSSSSPSSSSSSSSQPNNGGTVASPRPIPPSSASTTPKSRLGASLAQTSKIPPSPGAIIRTNNDATAPVPGRVTHTVKLVAAMEDLVGGGVWQAKWRSIVFQGMELLTSHDDGSLRIWKAARDGRWLEFAAVETAASSLSSSSSS